MKKERRRKGENIERIINMTRGAPFRCKVRPLPISVEIGRLSYVGASAKKNAPKSCEITSKITFFSTSEGAHPLIHPIVCLRPSNMACDSTIPLFWLIEPIRAILLLGTIHAGKSRKDRSNGCFTKDVRHNRKSVKIRTFLQRIQLVLNQYY